MGFTTTGQRAHQAYLAQQGQPNHDDVYARTNMRMPDTVKTLNNSFSYKTSGPHIIIDTTRSCITHAPPIFGSTRKPMQPSLNMMPQTLASWANSHGTQASRAASLHRSSPRETGLYRSVYSGTSDPLAAGAQMVCETA